MAGAAATFEREAYTFDWDFAEEQFVEPEVDFGPMNERPPESEIYGRSLSAIRRLGAFMVEATSHQEVIESPEAAQARIEFITSVEEGFGTDMELGGGLEVRDFDKRPIIDGRVMSKDLKRAVSDMTEAGLECAEKEAKNDAQFQPQLTRSHWDHENALIVDQMAQGKTAYNTRIVISPYPEEAAAQSGDDYWRNVGYVPHLKRGFVQLYHYDGKEVITGSLSFDGSDKHRLREVFRKCGIEIPAGETTDNWLQYAVTDNLTTEQSKMLATGIADKAGNPSYKKNTNTVDVTEEYKPVMDQVFDESYIHIGESLARGYQTEGLASLVRQLADKAPSFNERYENALYRMRADRSRFTDSDTIVLHELLVYSTIEMMRALHLKKTKPNTSYSHISDAHLSSDYLQSLDASSFQSMLGGFGAEGAMNGRVYSACGLEIAAGDGKTDKSLQSAYGGLADDLSDEAWLNRGSGESKTWKYKIGLCKVPNCPRSVKPAMVGPCGVCKNCEHKDNRGANLMTFYSEGPKSVDQEQSRFDELFATIANAELEIKEADLVQKESEIAPHIDEVFEEQKPKEELQAV